MAKEKFGKVVKPPHVPHPGSAGKAKSVSVHTPSNQNLGGTKETHLNAWNRHKKFSY